jgi:hypothetical protein
MSVSTLSALVFLAHVAPTRGHFSSRAVRPTSAIGASWVKRRRLICNAVALLYRKHVVSYGKTANPHLKMTPIFYMRMVA